MKTETILRETNRLSILYNKERKTTKVSIRNNNKKTPEEINEYNKLFAEFLKWGKESPTSERYETPFTWEEPNVQAFLSQRNDYSIDMMEFTKDMNWLDLVIDKLESLDCIVRYSKSSVGRSSELIIKTNTRIEPSISVSYGDRMENLIELCYHSISYLKHERISLNLLRDQKYNNYEFPY